MEEISKSIKSILYERVTSPFWGAMIISWLIWNWEIPYLSFFVPSDKLDVTKIEYIKEYLITNNLNIYWGPILTVILILGLTPFISGLAFWWNLKYNTWKIERKRIEENKVSLSVEKSVQLRNTILKQDELFEKLNKKNEEKQIELSNQLKSLEVENLDLSEKIKELEQKIEQSKLQLESYKERNDFTKIFKKVSVYNIDDKVKWKFQISNLNEIEFRRDNEYIKFRLYEIKNHGSEDFEILMYPDNVNKAEEIEIRIISLKRTSEIHEFIGHEVRIVRKGGKLVKSEIHSIQIYDLL